MDATATATATAREGETLRVNPPYTLRRKRDDGLVAETEIALPQLDVAGNNEAQGYTLTLSTSKAYRGGGIETRASIARHRDGFRTMDLFGDFSKSVNRNASRGTEKAIRTLHEQSLERVAAIVTEVEAFYAAKRAKAAEEKARYEARACA